MDTRQYINELAKILPAMIQQQIINHVGINGVTCEEVDPGHVHHDPEYRFILTGYFVQSRLRMRIVESADFTVVLFLYLELGGFCIHNERTFDYYVPVPTGFDSEVFTDDCHCIAWEIAKSLKLLQDRIQAKADF